MATAGVGQGGSRKRVSGNERGEAEQDWGGGVTQQGAVRGGEACVALWEGWDRVGGACVTGLRWGLSSPVPPHGAPSPRSPGSALPRGALVEPNPQQRWAKREGRMQGRR